MGACYRQITVDRPPDARTWRRIERAAGALCAGMVVAQDIRLPQDGAITAFCGEDRFMPLLCVNTAARVLSSAQLPIARRTVGFIDPKGTRQSLLLRLLECAPAVVVRTDAPKRYEFFCEQVLESLGAPVTLAGDESTLAGCAVVAAPDGADAALLRLLDAPVVSAHPQSAGCRAPVLTCLQPQLLPGMDVDASVSPAQFLGALYERCGVAALEDTSARWGRVEGRMTTVAQFAQRIRQYGQKSENKT